MCVFCFCFFNERQHVFYFIAVLAHMHQGQRCVRHNSPPLLFPLTLLADGGFPKPLLPLKHLHTWLTCICKWYTLWFIVVWSISKVLLHSKMCFVHCYFTWIFDLHGAEWCMSLMAVFTFVSRRIFVLLLNLSLTRFHTSNVLRQHN